MDKQKFAIVIAQVVRGRSRGPKGLKRYKPFKYKELWNSHGIVYAKTTTTLEKDAIIETRLLEDEMRAIMSRENPRGKDGYTKSYYVSLHNVTKDEGVKWSQAEVTHGTYGLLYDNVVCTNQILERWKIVI